MYVQNLSQIPRKLHHPLHDTPWEWLGLRTNTARLALEKDLI